MDENNERFESFLREFRPRHPRSLPETTTVAPVIGRRLAAAAIVTLGLAASILFLLRTSAPDATRLADRGQATAPATRPVLKPFSSIELTRLALENQAAEDAALAVVEENRLPRFDRPNTVLHVLAHE